MNSLKNKIELPILISFIFIACFTTIFINSKILNKKDVLPDFSNEIVEPETNVSDDILINDYKSTSDTKKIDSIQYIDSIQFSPDSSVAIVENWVINPTVPDPTVLESTVQPSVPQSETLNTKKLTIIDSEGVILDEVEGGDVYDAKFGTNDQLYYQKTGDDFGIFSYTIEDGVKKNFVETADHDYFNNIGMIDNDNYFFVQPKTGKYGYGNIESGEVNIIGQKATNEESIEDINKASYSNTVISNDKKLIFVVEKVVSDQGINFILQAFLINDTQFITPELSYNISTSYTDIFNVSQDRKFITVGKDALTINTETKSIVYRNKEDQISDIHISPDETKSVVCTGNGKSKICSIRLISDEGIFSNPFNGSLPDGISGVAWIDDDNIVFVIGKSLYDYKLSTKQLEKVFEDRDEYRILARNEKNGSVIVIKGEEVKELGIRK